MSKHLVKILSICALAILLPLTIVGVALCVTEPVSCSLVVEEKGKDGQFTGDTSISISVEGESVEGNSIKVKKNSEIVVTFQGEGYDFDGWYKGKPEEIQTDDVALESKTTYKFTIKSNTKLTAVRNVIEYNVTYAGLLDDKQTSVSTQIAELNQTVEYGETLESLSSISGFEWQGWYVADSEGATETDGTKVAKFDKTEVTLKPVWSNPMIVTYKKGETMIKQERVSKDLVPSYSLLSATSSEVVSALTKGKSFEGWVDADGDPVTKLTYNIDGYVLYLQEKTIVYNLNVKYNAVSDENPTSITYDIENGFSACAYEAQDYRVYYTFKGFEFGGTDYIKAENDYVSASGAKLSDKIIAGEVSGTVNAVWECEFAPIMFNIEGACYYKDAEWGLGEWAVYGTKDGADDVIMKAEDLSINFEDKAEADYYDINDNVYDLFISVFTNCYVTNVDGVEGNVDVAFANQIKIYIGSSNQSVDFSFDDTNITFKDIMAAAQSENDGSLEDVEFLTIKFMFTQVA